MLSSKLMTMKFMSNTNGNRQEDTTVKAADNKTIDDAHWRLDFRDVTKTNKTTNVEVASSYTAFQGLSNGRRNFCKDAKPIIEESKEETESSDGDEAPEDAFARRKSEKEADNDSLRAMKGMKTLSGNSPNTNNNNNNNKRKGKVPSFSHQKKLKK